MWFSGLQKCMVVRAYQNNLELISAWQLFKDIRDN